MSDPRTEWAVRLGAPATATPDEARAAFLRALPDAEFVPYTGSAAALNALAGTAVPVGDGETARETVRAEVAALAAGFWELDPPARRAAWEALKARTTGGDAARLRALEPGLTVVTDPLPNPEAEELAQLVRELFVLPPRARGLRRNEWLAVHTRDSLRWCAAQKMLAALAPEVAALDESLAAVLSHGKVAEAFAEGCSANPRDLSDVDRDVAEFQERARLQTAGMGTKNGRVDRENIAEKVERWGKYFTRTIVISFIVILALAGVISALTKKDKNESALPLGPRGVRTPASYNPQPYSPPPITMSFSRESIAECERYERDKSRQQPTQFAGWVLCGRPRTPGTYNLALNAPRP